MPSTTHPADRIAVVGAGPMGLAAAYELCRLGLKPVLFEADDRPGGMAASFDFAGMRLERFYHFHCIGDQAFLDLLGDLGLSDELEWRPIRVGFFVGGRLLPWGTARAVLRYRGVPVSARIRYLLHTAHCLTLLHWHHLDRINATTWLKRWLGEPGYSVFWEKLLAYKFYHHSEEISAAWIWSRLRRFGLSRRGLRQTVGYLRGGSQQLIAALEQAICSAGGELRLSSPVRAIRCERAESLGDGAIEITTPHGQEKFAAAISTIPLPLVAPILEEGRAPAELVEQYRSQGSVACACVIVQTRTPITNMFWINVKDDRFRIPGFIEMSNLRPLRPHITYVPFYMPTEHPDYQRPDQAFIDDSISCLRAAQPRLSDRDILATHCSRYRYAQPICGANFLSTLPPVNPLPNVWIADTTVYYPDDRGISESVNFARKLAREVAEKVRGRT